MQTTRRTGQSATTRDDISRSSSGIPTNREWNKRRAQILNTAKRIFNPWGSYASDLKHFAARRQILTASFQKAAADTAAITGGKLDYIIANAALVTLWDTYGPISVL
jgi:hypothetical protein